MPPSSSKVRFLGTDTNIVVVVKSSERATGAMDHLLWSMDIGTRHAEQEHGLYPPIKKISYHGYYLKDLQKMPTQIQVLH
jgi:hypothetical protein